LSIQNEAISLAAIRSKEISLVQLSPLSNLTHIIFGVASRGMKTYSEIRIELRDLQLLKKMLEMSHQLVVIKAAL